MFWVFDPSHVDCVIKVLEICGLWSIDWARPLHEHHSYFSFHSFVLGTNWALLWIIRALRLILISDMDVTEHVYAFCNTRGRFAETYQRVPHASTVFFLLNATFLSCIYGTRWCIGMATRTWSILNFVAPYEQREVFCEQWAITCESHISFIPHD